MDVRRRGARRGLAIAVALSAVALIRASGADPKGAAFGTIRVGPSADAYIKESAPRFPGTWGWMDMCRVGERAGGLNRTLLRFDLREIPRSATIREATLRLALAPYTNREVEAHRYGAYVLRLPDPPGWTAEDVDADLRISGGTSGGTSGAAWPEGGVTAASPGPPVAIGKVLFREEGGRRIPEAIAFDLTAAVRGWVSGETPNCGIVLDGRLEGGAYDVYSSRAFEAAKRPYLEIALAPSIERRPAPAEDVPPALAGDDWVEPMRRVHARFAGKKGLCVLYGDSITYSMAFLGTAAWGETIPYKNVPPEARPDLEAVWAHADRAFWRRRDPSLGQLGQMRSDWFLSNVDGWQSQMKPEACVILFGTNDLGNLCPPDYTENMAAAIRRILADGTVPILTTVPPASGRERFIQDYYRACWSVARHFRIPVIDYCAEILRRRPDDWNGALPQHREKAKDASGRVDGYEVLAPISGDGTHPSNPAPYRGDFGEEALNNNGYVLRDYLTLRKYGEVIRKVFRDGARIEGEDRP
ncbi:MAG: DNRLRE domain-containing protein [Planctomycetes bacterium]|nr:DNRLRE domain-containing protein [Planctomycetota bacterium]